MKRMPLRGVWPVPRPCGGTVCISRTSKGTSEARTGTQEGKSEEGICRMKKGGPPASQGPREAGEKAPASFPRRAAPAPHSSQPCLGRQGLGPSTTQPPGLHYGRQQCSTGTVP